MKKKLLLGSAVLALLSGLAMTSCGNVVSSDTRDPEIVAVYEAYKENGGTLSYEDWLKSIKGEDGKDGKGVSKIEKTGTSGNVDTYTITYTDGTTTTFTVTNGKDGSQGIQGEKGENGHTPIITIGEDGYWYVDGVKTDTKATGQSGADGRGILSITKEDGDGTNVDTYKITYTDGTSSYFTVYNGVDGEKGDAPSITIGPDGYWYVDGVKTDTKAEGSKGEEGDRGNGILSIAKTGSSGNVDTYTITYTNGEKTTFTVVNGKDGNGIAKIEKTGTSGNVDTYTITYTDGTTTTFTVANGVDGEKGDTPSITIGEDGYWYVDGVKTDMKAEGSKGDEGNGIASIEKTNTVDNVDTYTITYTNGEKTTFTVVNGIDGEDGKDGVDAPTIVDIQIAYERDDAGNLVTVYTFYFSDGTTIERRVSMPKEVLYIDLRSGDKYEIVSESGMYPEIEVYVQYDDATFEIVPLDPMNSNIAEIDFTTAGWKTLIVTIEGKSEQFEIIVYDPSNLTVKDVRLEDGGNYPIVKEGENRPEIQVTVYYSNGSSELMHLDSANSNIDEIDFTTTGSKDLTITIGEETYKFEINVYDPSNLTIKDIYLESGGRYEIVKEGETRPQISVDVYYSDGSVKNFVLDSANSNIDEIDFTTTGSKDLTITIDGTEFPLQIEIYDPSIVTIDYIGVPDTALVRYINEQNVDFLNAFFEVRYSDGTREHLPLSEAEFVVHEGMRFEPNSMTSVELSYQGYDFAAEIAIYGDTQVLSYSEVRLYSGRDYYTYEEGQPLFTSEDKLMAMVMIGDTGCKGYVYQDLDVSMLKGFDIANPVSGTYEIDISSFVPAESGLVGPSVTIEVLSLEATKARLLDHIGGLWLALEKYFPSSVTEEDTNSKNMVIEQINNATTIDEANQIYSDFTYAYQQKVMQVYQSGNVVLDAKIDDMTMKLLGKGDAAGIRIYDNDHSAFYNDTLWPEPSHLPSTYIPESKTLVLYGGMDCGFVLTEDENGVFGMYESTYAGKEQYTFKGGEEEKYFSHLYIGEEITAGPNAGFVSLGVSYKNGNFMSLIGSYDAENQTITMALVDPTGEYRGYEQATFQIDAESKTITKI